jgi:hypothetical protein
MIKESLYANEYPSWGDAPKALIEKQPQYPYYSLPFRGKSEYRENFNKNKDENYINKGQGKESARYNKGQAKDTKNG